MTAPVPVTWPPRCRGEAETGFECQIATDDADCAGTFHCCCVVRLPGLDAPLIAGQEYWDKAREDASAAVRLLHGAQAVSAA